MSLRDSPVLGATVRVRRIGSRVRWTGGYAAFLLPLTVRTRGYRRLKSPAGTAQRLETPLGWKVPRLPPHDTVWLTLLHTILLALK